MTGQCFRNTTSRPTPEWESSVRAQVDRVLASAKLRVPPRRRRLLRYLVDRTLKGESGEITEYAIALDVFERPPSFDPKTDAIWFSLRPVSLAPPEFSLAVLPLSIAPGAAAIETVTPDRAEAYYGPLTQTKGLSLIDWERRVTSADRTRWRTRAGACPRRCCSRP